MKNYDEIIKKILTFISRYLKRSPEQFRQEVDILSGRFYLFIRDIVPKRVKRFLRVHKVTFVTFPFIYYFINVAINTLKFESTFLILFFLIFINLLYVNIYSYVVVELDKYSFNMYLSYKETVARRIKRIKSNLTFFKLRKNKLSSIVKRFSKAIAVNYVNNYNHFKIFADFTLVFFVHKFVTNLTSTQLNFKKF